jgi:predicted HicB family RNase H-like nuclease
MNRQPTVAARKRSKNRRPRKNKAEAKLYMSIFWPVRLKRLLALKAEQEGTSMNALINKYIAEGMGGVK